MNSVMDRAVIQEKLFEYIEQATDKKLQGLYMLVEDEIGSQPSFTLSEDELRILDEEREKHLQGESRSYNLSEAQSIIRGQRSL
jgi:hypothetical protein